MATKKTINSAIKTMNKTNQDIFIPKATPGFERIPKSRNVNTNKIKNAVPYTINFEDEDIKLCTSIYRQMPWMKESVEFIYVNPIALSSYYYDEKSSVFINEVKFYKVNKNYYVMRCRGELLSINDDNSITVNYNNQIMSFQVGFKVSNIKTPFIQNKKMYEDEKKYVINSLNISDDLYTLKNANVSVNLYNLALNTIRDISPNEEFAEEVVNSIKSDHPKSIEFATKITKISVASKLNPVFKKRMTNGYLNPNTIHHVPYSELLYNTEYNIEDVKNYVEDATINLILYANKKDDIPLRKYPNRERRLPKVKQLDVRLKCYNVDDVVNVEDENMVFYEDNNKLYCFNVKSLFSNFRSGNYVNQYTGINFKKQFIDKVESMYNYKNSCMPQSLLSSKLSLSENENNTNELAKPDLDPEYEKIYKIVMEEINKLFISNTDECKKCKRKIDAKGITSVDVYGRELKMYCSRQCFERS